ncbi:PREDICTED: LOW QUALITY PROTEIN: Golgi membrane protein 1 [Hipposideros armiger]|uniref:LOW QUALITY PROTEIN: Golgi membrane protein 1 n=1 Tax=Hipposideros armiger TaxID=186990 RepID=A0A8B7Q0L8_HIPAR|nr:PREDICTED: LOW QUALITY PROTEIN: Golgi membrane protein 1 [Hipposideros armiger]
MMGLGNGRRTMKSPPLVLAALVACIIVLGFNYWIASSRSVDLQQQWFLQSCKSMVEPLANLKAECGHSLPRGHLLTWAALCQPGAQVSSGQLCSHAQGPSEGLRRLDPLSGASRQACPVATFRPDRLPSGPFSARGSRPGTPRRSLETPPSLRPGCSLLPESARGRPLTSSRRSPWTRPPGPAGAQVPGAEGSCEDSLPQRRPVWGDAEPFFLFFAWSRASASKVRSVRPQSRTSASPAGVVGARAGTGGWPRRSPHLCFLPPPPRRARAVAGAHVGSGRVLAGDLELAARAAWTAPPDPMWSPSGMFQVLPGCSAWAPSPCASRKPSSHVEKPHTGVAAPSMCLGSGLCVFSSFRSVLEEDEIPSDGQRMIINSNRSSMKRSGSAGTSVAMPVTCVISCPPFGLDQLKALQKNYGKLQQDVLQFQKNQTNLEKKFSYDLSQCINQMKEVKEQCEERIEEVTKKGNEAVASRDMSEKKDQGQQLPAPNESQPRLQEAGLAQAEAPKAKENMPSNGEPQTPAPTSEVSVDLKRQGEKEETNDIQVISEELRRDSLGLPPEPDLKQAVEEDRQAGGRGVGDAGDLGQTPQVPAALLMSQENEVAEDPERDQLVIRDGQEEEQDADEEGRHQQKPEEDDDYNMDENEAESERDKQAALAGNDRNENVLNAENQKRDDKFT